MKRFIPIIFYFIFIFELFSINASPNVKVSTSKENVMPRLEDMEVLVEYAKYWAHKLGLIIHTKIPDKKDAAKFLPFALFPSPIPRRLFVKAVRLQKAFNELYFRVSQDHKFLIEKLKPLVHSNGRVRAWLNILEEVEAEGIIRQPITLLLARSDYMFHRSADEDNMAKLDEYELKQIEFNMGNYGGAWFGVQQTKLHRQIMSISGRKFSYEFMPKNASVEHMAVGIYEAWKSYGDKNAIVLMVSNKFSRWHEFGHVDVIIEQLSNKRIKIVYLSLMECAEKLSLDDNFTLRLDNTFTVGVVHFKNLFSTDPPPQVIAARRIIERSKAISSPTVAQDLAATKKIQQILAMPGMLECFFPEPEKAEIVAELRSTFAGMWGLDIDDEKTTEIIEDAIKSPDNYVLKPSQEGGGHNFWGKEIAEKLGSFSSDERAAHILMQRVKPMVIKNILFRPYENIQFENVVTELSIYGYLLANVNSMKVLQNMGEGHIMRTKVSSSNEGGVGKNSGVTDSPYLI